MKSSAIYSRSWFTSFISAIRFTFGSFFSFLLPWRAGVFVLAVVCMSLSKEVVGQYVVDFEGDGEIKTEYASGTVNLSGLDWDMTEALIGTLDNDWKNGIRSARLRGRNESVIQMLEDKFDGAGTISFYYRRYGSDGAQQPWAVEYSVNGGISWVQIGDIFTATDDVQLFESTINIPDNIRFRIRLTTSPGTTGDRRMNIDDIVITEYSEGGICGIESFLNSNLTASYLDGSFNGYGGITWNYGHSRNEGDYPIDANGIMLRRASDSYLEATIPRGLRTISFDYRKAFSGDAPRQLELIVDGEQVAVTEEFGGFSGEDETVHNFRYFLNSSEEVTIRIKNIGTTTTNRQVVIDNITWTCYSPCENPTWHFQTVSSGEWKNMENWETSADGEGNWVESYCPIDESASSVIIQDEHHMVLDADLSAKTIHIQPNASLQVTSGILTLGSNGGGSVILEPGALLDFNGAEKFVINMGATVLVESNATLRVSINRAGFSDGLAGNSSSGRIIYQTGSVFEWNNNSAFATSNQVYFPNANDETIPIFRVNGSPTVSATTPTTINGIFEANGNVTWQNSGAKIFRNGITGTGTITQAETSGAFIINGETAQLGGSGNLVLASEGLEISSSNAMLSSDKTIEGGEVKISGSLDMDFNTLTLGGDLVVEESGNLISEDGTLVFNGATLQQLKIPEPFTVSGFTLDNAAGLTINDSLTVSNTLNLVAGVVNMPGHILTLGNSSQTGSLISSGGYVDGTYRVWLHALSGLGVKLPLGYGNDYAPVDITFDGSVLSPGTLTARFDKNLPDNYYGNLPITDTGDDTDDEVVVNNLSSEGYWHIQSGHGLATGAYTITLGIPASMGEPIVYPELLRLVKREDAHDDWKIAGSFESATKLSITHSDVIGFSEFALGGNYADNPLPIELLHFTATEKGDKVLLTWATASETNNDFFTLERGVDAKHVETIGSVAGAGSSAQTLHYSFTDANPYDGISYYRLKQTDFDGAYEYSQWIALERGVYSSSLRIVRVLQQNNILQLQAEAPVGQPILIEVYDLYGRNLYQTQVIPETHLFQHSFSSEFKGMAIIRLSSQKETAVKKLILR